MSKWPWFHRHKWTIVERSYVKSIPLPTNLKCSEQMAERMLFGLTSYIYECSACGKIRKEELLGKSDNG